MILLRIVFFLQLPVMLSAFAALLLTPAQFQTLGVLVYSAAVGLAAAVVALWQFLRHPASRKWALAVMATPLICLTTPFLIVRVSDGPVAPAMLGIGVLAFAVFACLVLLARQQRWQPGALFTTRRFNLGMLCVLLALLFLYWLPVFGWLSAQDTFTLPRQIEERDRLLQLGLIYVVAVAGPALLLSLFTLLYAPIGLVRGGAGRAVHLSQLLFALTTLASLGAGAFAAGIALVNPG